MRKGFTLVELLAVLTILAIISLIAIPIAINIIDSSSEKVSERSRDNYIRAVNVAIGNYNTKATEEIIDATCAIQSNGDLKCGNVLVKLNIKNNPAISGTVIIKNYNVVGYVDLKISERTFTKLSFGGTYVAPSSTDTHKGIVYMDPTDISKKCTAQAAAENVNMYGTPTTIKTGCMKFYIYDDTGSSYKMIVDHNTSGGVSWVTCGETIELGANSDCRQPNWGTKNTYGPIAAIKRLNEDTAGWVGTPRLISVDEVAHIVGIDTAIGWNSTDPNSFPFYLDGSGSTREGWEIDWNTINIGENASNYAWLFNNIHNCTYFGCNVEDNNEYLYISENYSGMGEIYGYWTSSASAQYDFDAWGVSSDFIAGTDYDVTDADYGIRPVITIPKSIFE